MKKIAFIVVFSLIAAQETLELEDGSVIQVEPGLQKVGTLDSNPSTGYMWVFHYPDSNVFSVSDLGFTKYSNKALIGSGGFQSFGFNAEESCQKGESVDVVFEYKRGLETIPAQILEVKVVC